MSFFERRQECKSPLSGPPVPHIPTIFLGGEWELHTQSPGELPLDPTQHPLLSLSNQVRVCSWPGGLEDPLESVMPGSVKNRVL